MEPNPVWRPLGAMGHYQAVRGTAPGGRGVLPEELRFYNSSRRNSRERLSGRLKRPACGFYLLSLAKPLTWAFAGTHAGLGGKGPGRAQRPYHAGGHATGPGADHEVGDLVAPELLALGVGQEGQGRLLKPVRAIGIWKDRGGGQ